MKASLGSSSPLFSPIFEIDLDLAFGFSETERGVLDGTDQGKPEL